MSVFNPETAARALFPHELMKETTALHFALHLSPHEVQVAAGNRDGEIVWCERFAVESNHADPWRETRFFLNERNWSQQIFRKSSISYDTSYFTLVPSGFISTGREGDILRFHHPQASLSPVSEQLADTGITLIYDFPEKIKSIADTFPGAYRTPVVSFFLRYCFLLKERTGNRYFVYVHSGKMLLAAFKEGAFQLCSAFDIQGHEDVLYHLANTAMRLNTDMAPAQITFIGNAVEKELISLVQTYTHGLKKWETPVSFQWKKDEPAELFFPSLVHFLCA